MTSAFGSASSLRSSATADSAAARPRSGIGTSSTAVRPSAETRWLTSPVPPVTASACSPRAPSWPSVAMPATTIRAWSGAPGNSRSIACSAAIAGTSCGSSFGWVSPVCMPSAGTASAPSTKTAVSSAARGRFVTAPAIAAQARPRRGRLPKPGRRPRLILSPSSASTAGRTVTEPITAIATTAIVPSAMLAKTDRPVTSRPASATMTVSPETTIARPTVAAVAASAACLPLPAARSSRSRRM